jgi:hypothetical protein
MDPKTKIQKFNSLFLQTLTEKEARIYWGCACLYFHGDIKLLTLCTVGLSSDYSTTHYHLEFQANPKQNLKKTKNARPHCIAPEKKMVLALQFCLIHSL